MWRCPAISLDDDRHTPAPTLDLLRDTLAAAPIERVRVTSPDLDAPLDHFTWVRRDSPIAARVATFAMNSPRS
jgi:predicted alpha/beta hydrolase